MQKNESINLRNIVMPNDTNPSGFLFGGVLLSWIDMAAAMVAQKHAQMDVATVKMEEVAFKHPICLGDHVVINASIKSVGKTSMHIQVDYHKENPILGTQSPVTSVNLTFVAMKNGNPADIPPLN